MDGERRLRAVGERRERGEVARLPVGRARPLERAGSELTSRRRPDDPVAGLVLAAQARADRDQLGEVVDGHGVAERRDAYEPVRVEVIPEEERGVAVARREQPR